MRWFHAVALAVVFCAPVMLILFVVGGDGDGAVGGAVGGGGGGGGAGLGCILKT